MNFSAEHKLDSTAYHILEDLKNVVSTPQNQSVGPAPSNRAYPIAFGSPTDLKLSSSSSIPFPNCGSNNGGSPRHFLPPLSWRHWFWIVLSERATKYRHLATYRPSQISELFVGLLVLSNVGLACWSISAPHDEEKRLMKTVPFYALQYTSTLVFACEYGLRFWSCVEDEALKEKNPILARCIWMAKPLSLLDILCLSLIFAFEGVAWASNEHKSITTLLELRILMLLRLERQLKALGRLKSILGSEVGELMLSGFFTLCLVIYSGVLFYFIEHPGDHDIQMGSSIWWAVQTVTSLGYGTELPQTAGGKFLSGIMALVGLVAFAIPAGIISSRFALLASHEREQQSIADDIDYQSNETNGTAEAARPQIPADDEIPGSPFGPPSFGPLSGGDHTLDPMLLRQDLDALHKKVDVLAGKLNSICRLIELRYSPATSDQKPSSAEACAQRPSQPPPTSPRTRGNGAAGGFATQSD